MYMHTTVLSDIFSQDQRLCGIWQPGCCARWNRFRVLDVTLSNPKESIAVLL